MRGNAFFLVAVLAFQAAVSAQATFQTRTQKGKSGLTMGYRLFVPAGYDKTLKYPLVPALHGSGEPPSPGLSGDMDPTVNVSGSRNMIAAIKRAGGDPIYTEYAGVGHDSWTRAMKEPALFPWMPDHKRSGSTRLETHAPRRRALPVVSEDKHLYRPDGRLTPARGEKANPEGRGLPIIPPRAD